MKLWPLITCACRKVNPTRSGRRFSHERIWNRECTVVTEASIREKLTSFSVPFTDGYACLLVKNCFCQNAGDFNERTDVFINKRTGLFLCEQCKVTGDWNMCRDLLERAKGNLSEVKSCLETWSRYDRNSSNWNEVVAKSTPLKGLPEESYKQVFREFGLRACSKAAAERLKIRISQERDALYFPLFCADSGVVGYKSLGRDGTERTFPRLDCPGFLLQSGKGREAVVVVANIPDFLALISQNLHNYDICCLQYGASHLPQTTLPFFEKYKKVVLWLGEKSLDAGPNLSRKLNEKRCYVVRPTGNRASPSAALSGDEDLKAVLADAKLAWHPYVTTFGALREEVLAELQNAGEVAGVPWKRFPLLTKVLKGHRRGELTVLTGPTGVGKTTFLSEYSLDLAAQGVNTLWGSFEVKNSRLARTLLTQFARAPLTSDPAEYNALCDRFEQLPMFFLSFHGQQDLSNVMDAVTHCSYTYDIAHVIIDNVQFMIEVSPDVNQLDRFWKQDYMVQAFRSFATRNNCHVTLVMHPKKIEGVDLGVNSIFGGVKASQEADNVLIIQKKELNSLRAKKYLQVCKNRFSGDLGLIPLSFDKASLCFSRTGGGAKDPRARQDTRTVPEDEDWDESPEEVVS